MSDAILTFTSHIAGKNAKVSVYPDRIEWDRRGVSGGKLAAGIMTAGISTLATGIRNKETEMIPVRSISSITSKKGMAHTTVSVITSGNTVDMRVSHGEAGRIKDTLQRLIAAA